MKRKVNAVEAAPLPTCAAIGPEDMVLIACLSGESYLIERNCALLSSLCRDTLMVWENAIRRVANQYRSDQSITTATVTPTDVVGVGFPNNGPMSSAVGERASNVRLLTDFAENANMTIPFMAAWDADEDAAAAASWETRVQHIPLATVAERYQQRLDAATPTKVERPSSSKLPSSHGDRKGVMVVPKPISPLAPWEDGDGLWLYPVVQMTYVTPPLLEASLAYAAKKYKMDMDGDKMPAESVPPVSAIATGEQWQMIAAAVLTGM